MTTAPDGAASAPVAEDDVKTDEQVWNELKAERATPADTEPAAWQVEGDEDEPAAASDPETPSDVPEQGETEAAPSEDPAALRATIERLEHATKSDRGRISAQARELASLRAQIAEARKRPATKPDDTLRQSIEKLRSEYPDVAGPLVDQIEALKGELGALSAVQRQDLAAKEQQVSAITQAEEARFLQEHPDGFDVVQANGPAFLAWIEDQPKALRDAYAANAQAIVDGTGAALLVARFKESLRLAQPGSTAPAAASPSTGLTALRQRQIAGATVPRTATSARAPAMPDPDSEDPEVLWNYWRKQGRDRAQR
jgi:hypothetical protein